MFDWWNKLSLGIKIAFICIIIIAICVIIITVVILIKKNKSKEGFVATNSYTGTISNIAASYISAWRSSLLNKFK